MIWKVPSHHSLNTPCPVLTTTGRRHHPLQIPFQPETSAPSCLHLLRPTQDPTAIPVPLDREEGSREHPDRGEQTRSWWVLLLTNFVTSDKECFAGHLRLSRVRKEHPEGEGPVEKVDKWSVSSGRLEPRLLLYWHLPWLLPALQPPQARTLKGTRDPQSWRGQ